MDRTWAFNVRLQVSLCHKCKQKGKIYMLNKKNVGKKKTDFWLITTFMNYNPSSKLVIRNKSF